jgi:hypothetical protein
MSPKMPVALVLLLLVSARSLAQPLAVIPNRSGRPLACLDGVPHKKALVSVDKGVTLEVLDWGGADKSRTMVLLTGLGDNAHVFDQFAFQFTDYQPSQEVCIGLRFGKNGAITGSTTPGWISRAILQGVQEPANPPTDWAQVEAPRLGIFSQPSVEGRLPYYWYLSDQDKQTFDASWPAIVNWYTDTINEFAAEQPAGPSPVVYRLPDASHYFYLNSNQAFVVKAMRNFLLGSVG